jgi:hypothetical protein
VPVDALVDAGGRPLVERFALSYVHSPSTFVAMEQRSRASRVAGPARAWFVDGDLLGGDDGEGGEGRIGAQARFAAHTHVRPGLGTEQAIRKAWRRGSGRVPPGLFQFDGHALVDLRLPGGSALVLEGKGDGMRALAAPAAATVDYVDDPDDGLLTVSEIEQLHLPADLVVLAACQSAGRYDYGAFHGVGDAFLRAGADCVLTSLWPVDQRATVELVRRFYAHAYAPGGTMRMPLAEALRRARQELREFQEPGGARPFAHPAYWAPFVLVGDPARGPGASAAARR